MSAVRIAVVVGEPDGRPSTDRLRTLVEAIDRRPDTEVEVLHLRRRPEDPAWWPTARTVDDLRRSPSNRALEAVGLTVLAGRLRGLRLRWWFRAARPDVVVLDDALGERLLGAVGGRPVVVIRTNEDAAASAVLEARPTRVPDLVIAHPDGPAPPEGVETIWSRHLLPDPGNRRRIEAERSTALADLGLAEGTPLLVGWGADGWLDGSNLFVRVLWHLEHRHGLRAHALWLWQDHSPEHLHHLVAEARRCGVEDRLHLEPAGAAERRWVGDAVFLPHRSLALADQVDLVEMLAGGQVAVTFPAEGAEAHDESDRWHVVDHLDLDGAAAVLAPLLRRPRTDRIPDDRARLQPDVIIDRLVEAAGGRLRRG